jgi:hypothetical protein
MLFGLTNAPAMFQHFINDVLRPFLDDFVTAYLNNILLYSDTMVEHRLHVRRVLEKVSEVELHLRTDKCKFHREKVSYLGLIISRDGVSMDPKKVEAITKWGTPENLHDFRAFLGFANFYRRFIKGYSNIVAPIVALTQMHHKFFWSNECKKAFQFVKDSST